MSLMDVIFGKGPNPVAAPAAAPATAPATKGAQTVDANGNPVAPAQATPGALTPGSNPVDPAKGPPAGIKPGESSLEHPALADFSKLWDNVKIPGSGIPVLQADPQKLADAAKGIDFTRIIPQELAAKAVGGDAAALLQIINTVAQQSFALGNQVNTALISKHGETIANHVDGTLGTRIKSHQVLDGLRTDNPAFGDPAVAPLIQALERQMQATFPDASAAELRQHAETYLSTVAGLVASKGKSKKQRQGGNEADGDGDSETVSGRMQQQSKDQATGAYDWGKFVDPKSAPSFRGPDF